MVIGHTIATETNNASQYCQAFIFYFKKAGSNIVESAPDIDFQAIRHSMTANVRILFNPSCSKCRLSRELLESRGENIEVVEYLTTPPNREELEQILAMLKFEPRQLMRQNEAVYTELALDRAELSRDELIDAMLEQPILIERPIVIKNGRARIGRPPEQILDIL